MKNYRVRWDMDFEANSPEEAAQMAFNEIRQKNTAATNFDVLERKAGDTQPAREGERKPSLNNSKSLGWIHVKLPEA